MEDANGDRYCGRNNARMYYAARGGWTVRLAGITFEYASEDEAVAKAVELVVKGYAKAIER